MTTQDIIKELENIYIEAIKTEPILNGKIDSIISKKYYHMIELKLKEFSFPLNIINILDNKYFNCDGEYWSHIYNFPNIGDVIGEDMIVHNIGLFSFSVIKYMMIYKLLSISNKIHKLYNDNIDNNIDNNIDTYPDNFIHDKSVNEISRIIHGLYLGNYANAQYSDCHIINLDFEKSMMVKDNRDYLYLPIKDNNNAQISTLFKQTNLFINTYINKEGVYVHCRMGISRSVTIVIAYLTWCIFQTNEWEECYNNKEYNFLKIYNMMHKIRSCISPNLGFIGQLLLYEQKLICDKNCQIF